MGRFDDDPGINSTEFSEYFDQVRPIMGALSI